MSRTVAIIVPVYNGEQYLDECVESVLSQTYRDFTLLLIDDGSVDGSGKLCDDYAKKDERVRVIHKNNEGLIATWIRGVKETTEPYLMFLDCDDWIDSDMLEKLTKHISAKVSHEIAEYEIISSDYLIERGNGREPEKRQSAAPVGEYVGERLETGIKEKVLGYEPRTLILSRCMKLFSRALIENNISYCDPSIRMGEDVTITVPAILDAKRIVVVQDAFCYHYRFVDESMAHKYDAGLYDNLIRLREILWHIVDDKKLPGGRDAVRKEFIFLLMIEMKNELRRKDCSVGIIIKRVRDICVQQNTKEEMQLLENPIQDPASKILAFMMKHPSRAIIWCTRTIFALRDAKYQK